MRRLLILLAGVALAWWARRMLRDQAQGSAPGRVRSAAGQKRPAMEGPMVRDRICDTFLPRSRALTARAGSEEHYFCSEKCRQDFLAHSGAAAAPHQPTA